MDSDGMNSGSEVDKIQIRIAFKISLAQYKVC